MKDWLVEEIRIAGRYKSYELFYDIRVWRDV